MKKILLFLILLISLNSFSQNLRKQVVINNYHFASADTGYVYPISNNYTWSLQLVWFGITGTANAKYSIQVSYNGINWSDYYGDMSYTISTTSGNKPFEDDRFAFNYIKIRIERNNVTGGSLYGYLTLSENK